MDTRLLLLTNFHCHKLLTSVPFLTSQVAGHKPRSLCHKALIVLENSTKKMKVTIPLCNRSDQMGRPMANWALDALIELLQHKHKAMQFPN
jgi:hypothetical protein